MAGKVLAWLVLAAGLIVMLGGLVYGLLAPGLDGVVVGLILEIGGVPLTLAGLHLVIDGGNQ
jgi:hypothetical protein